MNLPDDASKDQSNCPTGYYRRNNGIVMQIPPPAQDKAVAPFDIDSIDTMNAETLRKLIRTVGGAIWSYALMDDAEKAEAARLKLYNKGMSAEEVRDMVPALDKWFDRTVGKAQQSIALDVKDDRLDKIEVDKLIRMAAMLDDPILIAPMPKKLDIDENACG